MNAKHKDIKERGTYYKIYLSRYLGLYFTYEIFRAGWSFSYYSCPTYQGYKTWILFVYAMYLALRVLIILA